MTEPQETTPAKATAEPAAEPTAKPTAKPAAKPAPPPQRPLPAPESIADWIAGDDSVPVGALFERRNLKTFDALVMQIKKKELLPQHWQVIAANEPPPDAEFDLLSEVGRLRVRYRDQELSRRRLAALRQAWRELRGKRPSLWSVSDLFAAMRRIYEHGHDVDWDDLLAAQRDVWRELDLPFGREQIDVLWGSLAFAREKTKK